MAGFDELDDGLKLVGDVLRGAGSDVGVAQVQRMPVAQERVRIVASQVVDVGKPLALPFEGLRHPVFPGRIDEVVLREVPDIGHVADVCRLPADRPGGAEDEVGREKRPEVADVRVIVHRGTATVESQVSGLLGLDRLGLAGERVVEAERAVSHERCGGGEMNERSGKTHASLHEPFRIVPIPSRIPQAFTGTAG